MVERSGAAVVERSGAAVVERSGAAVVERSGAAVVERSGAAVVVVERWGVEVVDVFQPEFGRPEVEIEVVEFEVQDDVVESFHPIRRNSIQ